MFGKVQNDALLDKLGAQSLKNKPPYIERSFLAEASHQKDPESSLKHTLYEAICVFLT